MSKIQTTLLLVVHWQVRGALTSTWFTEVMFGSTATASGRWSRWSSWRSQVSCLHFVQGTSEIMQGSDNATSSQRFPFFHCYDSGSESPPTKKSSWKNVSEIVLITFFWSFEKSTLPGQERSKGYRVAKNEWTSGWRRAGQAATPPWPGGGRSRRRWAQPKKDV